MTMFVFFGAVMRFTDRTMGLPVEVLYGFLVSVA